MAFSQPNARELQNRKILEELQLKKQMLLKQGVAPTLNTLGVSSTGSVSNIPATQSNDGVAMSASARAALHNAHAASFGYFVTQDSSFGNLILPVLPRNHNLQVIFTCQTSFFAHQSRHPELLDLLDGFDGIPSRPVRSRVRIVKLCLFHLKRLVNHRVTNRLHKLHQRDQCLPFKVESALPLTSRRESALQAIE
ncbi:SOSS complex subunit C like protein [Atta colombica]|uniref:SOSS complex subunit C like protein n=1 Tax=Atta colombica TaxID=520822 RepID=A0A195B7Q8_9HYME|nr:SOSS complex subunit C like protein [Atta colombica]